MDAVELKGRKPGVAGVCQALGWFAARVGIALMGVWALATLGLGAYVLAPLYSGVCFGDARFWRHHRQFVPGTLQVWAFLGRIAFQSDYRSMTSFMQWRDWWDAPRSGPDLRLVRVQPDWSHGVRSCGSCARCCTQISCPMHVAATGLCGIYGSALWNYFPCGRYPATQAQIAFYECPKWEVITVHPQQQRAA